MTMLTIRADGQEIAQYRAGSGAIDADDSWRDHSGHCMRTFLMFALPGAATEIIDCIMTKIPNGTRTVRVRDEGLY